jgi:hypothetical protein
VFLLSLLLLLLILNAFDIWYGNVVIVIIIIIFVILYFTVFVKGQVWSCCGGRIYENGGPFTTPGILGGSVNFCPSDQGSQ